MKHCEKDKVSGFTALDYGCSQVGDYNGAPLYMEMGCDSTGFGYGYYYADKKCTDPSDISPQPMFPGECNE